MNKKSITAVILVAIILIIWWLLQENTQLETPRIKIKDLQTNQETSKFRINGQYPIKSGQPNITTSSQGLEDNITLIENKLKQISNVEERAKAEWLTPIEFYGKVIDENSNAVLDAKVDCECNDLSSSGTSFYQTTSSIDGLFFISGIRGKLLHVIVNKEGYRSYSANEEFYYYAGQNENFTPNVSKRTIFRLQKKGTGVNLIHFKKSFRLPRNGTPIFIDLKTGNAMSSVENAFEIECWTHDNQKIGFKYDWKCTVQIPGGGLQIYSNQFPFVAPISGYLSADSLNMSANEPQWSYILTRNYFFQISDGSFGRMIFTMVSGGDNFCELDVNLNPSGSRNLEPLTEAK